MVRKNNLIIVLIIFISLVIIGALLYFSFKGDIKIFQETFDTLVSSGQFIKNSLDSNSPYTNITQSSNYLCDADECLVSGSMIVTKPLIKDTLQCSECTYNNGKNKATVLVNDGLYEYIERCSPAIDRPSNEGWRACKGIVLTEYKADFNFCPPNDPNYKFCNGAESLVSSQDAGKSYAAGEVKLKRRDTISFNPKNGDGTDITTREIRVRKFDLSCSNDVTTCSSSQIKCNLPSQCPSGSQFITDWKRCDVINSVSSREYKTDICRSIDNSFECFTPLDISDADRFKIYNKCDTTQKIGESTCGAFSNIPISAPSGQECFLLDGSGALTNQHGVGLGGLSCPNTGDKCSINQNKGVDGSASYETCILSGLCNVWEARTCPQGLFFDINTKSCELPKENVCNPRDAKCEGGDTIRKCVGITIAGKSGYRWSETTEQCLGELACYTNNNQLPDDYCSCKEVDAPKTTAIKCTSSTTYLEYSKDPKNANSCFAYRDLGGKVTIGQICDTKTNTITTASGCRWHNPDCSGKDEFCNTNVGANGACQIGGCAFNTPGSAPDTASGFICDTNGESPTYNTAICDKSKYVLATKLEFENNAKRCNGAQPQKVERIGLGTSSGACYQWVNDGDTCSGDFICKK